MQVYELLTVFTIAKEYEKIVRKRYYKSEEAANKAKAKFGRQVKAMDLDYFITFTVSELEVRG